MTPYEKLGFPEGQQFTADIPRHNGKIFVLSRDDNTEAPWFSVVSGDGVVNCLCLESLLTYPPPPEGETVLNIIEEGSTTEGTLPNEVARKELLELATKIYLHRNKYDSWYVGFAVDTAADLLLAVDRKMEKEE